MGEVVVVLTTSPDGSGRTEGAEQGLFKLKTAIEFVRYIAPARPESKTSAAENLLKQEKSLKPQPVDSETGLRKA